MGHKKLSIRSREKNFEKGYKEIFLKQPLIILKFNLAEVSNYLTGLLSDMNFPRV